MATRATSTGTAWAGSWITRRTTTAGLVLALAVVATAEGKSFPGRLVYSWRDNAANETGFQVERSNDGIAFTTIATVAADQTSFLDQNLVAGNRYWYRVAAFNLGGTSNYSPVIDGVAVDASQPLVQIGAVSSGPRGRLVNLSSRAVSQPDNPMTAGFVVRGGMAKSVLIRAIGPTLGDLFSVPSALPNPSLNVVRWTGSQYVPFAKNTDWSAGGARSLIQTVAARVFAFTLPDNSRDAAAVLEVGDGQYTAMASDEGGQSGVALMELYDADAAGEARLINLSTRAHVGTGADVLICGFVIAGEGTVTVLLRAVGARLAEAPFFLPAVLADPEIELYWQKPGGPSVSVFSQDNWGDGAADEVSAVGASVGAFALQSGSRDAAAVVTLGPGSYTAMVRGVDGAVGTALAEIYEVP